MPTTITLLVDNKAETELKSEHGLSIFIEHQGKRILFDNGQGDEALFYNAEKLGISLTNLDLIILSHGHYDHSGNLDTLLKNNPGATFYAHPDCTQTRYSLHPGKAPRTISLREKIIAALAAFPEKQKNFITSATEISPGMWLTGQIPRICDFEDTGGPFYLDKEKNAADPLYDDMSLWIETEDGLAVICGCCHSGLINTLNQIKKLTGQTRIKCLLGGLHLVNANQARIDATIDYLNHQNIGDIYPAHCTGDNAMSLLLAQCGKVQIAKAGLKFTV
jgi:7,8-dihydropterin-6-yl-methyl-4-(beta-D-ribofuranosyl)aminobenzene 5'-phosphate synthase